MRYRGVLFDLDGVLCHTDQFHYAAWKVIADALGVPFDEQINNRLRGVSRMDSLEIILEPYRGPALNAAEKEQLANEKNVLYRSYLAKMTPADLDADTKRALDALQAGGVLMAVASSSRNAQLILERLGLGNFFGAVVDGNQIAKSKPDPEVFTKAAAQLELAPAECLVVEDAAAGVAAAKAGGFACAGIGTASILPDVRWPLQTLAELPAIVLGEA